MAIVQIEWRKKLFRQRLAQGLDFCFRAHLAQQNGKLIAAETPRQMAFTGESHQAAGDFHQHFIARRMSPVVIDQFEVIAIEKQ